MKIEMRTKKTANHVQLLGLLLLTITFFSGCPTKPDLKELYGQNIKKLHLCYVMYMESHGYRGPKNEAKLKEYLKTDPSAVILLKRIDLTPEKIDDIFISERDNEPFVVRYGLRGADADHAIVFEKTGVDGKRMVALGKAIAMDNEEYEAVLAGDVKPEFYSPDLDEVEQPE